MIRACVCKTNLLVTVMFQLIFLGKIHGQCKTVLKKQRVQRSDFSNCNFNFIVRNIVNKIIKIITTSILFSSSGSWPAIMKNRRLWLIDYCDKNSASNKISVIILSSLLDREMVSAVVIRNVTIRLSRPVSLKWWTCYELCHWSSI